MTTFKAHFDGKTIVPDEEIHLPINTPLTVSAESVAPPNDAPTGTFADLLNSGLVGIWKDRTDIGDSLEFARKLRKQAETRHHEIDNPQ
ncbi:MAG: hypothetical protein ACTHN5_05850 [Phycisphaerae bacterium]